MKVTHSTTRFTWSSWRSFKSSVTLEVQENIHSTVPVQCGNNICAKPASQDTLATA